MSIVYLRQLEGYFCLLQCCFMYSVYAQYMRYSTNSTDSWFIDLLLFHFTNYACFQWGIAPG